MQTPGQETRTAPQWRTVSDVDVPVPGTRCGTDGSEATVAVEWQAEDTGGRWWEFYCQSCGDEALAPYRVKEA